MFVKRRTILSSQLLTVRQKLSKSDDMKETYSSQLLADS